MSRSMMATEAGLNSLAAIYGAPRWAERCKVETLGICDPDPARFADFTEAAAGRNSGKTGNLPRVRF